MTNDTLRYVALTAFNALAIGGFIVLMALDAIN